MTTISSNPIKNATNTPSESARTSAAKATAIQPTDDDSPGSAAIATFSTRAERLAQLNSDYDMLSPSFKLSEEFINRMANLRLISLEDSNTLQGHLPANKDGSRADTASLGELKSSMDAISQQLGPETTQGNLQQLFANAKGILDNINASKSHTFPIDPATAAAELDQFLMSEQSSQLSEDDTQSLQDLKAALHVADKLSPDKRASAEVSKYMEILSRFG